MQYLIYSDVATELTPTQKAGVETRSASAKLKPILVSLHQYLAGLYYWVSPPELVYKCPTSALKCKLLMGGVVQEKRLLRGKLETSAFIDPDSYQIAELAITKFVQLTPAPNGISSSDSDSDDAPLITQPPHFPPAGMPPGWTKRDPSGSAGMTYRDPSGPK